VNIFQDQKTTHSEIETIIQYYSILTDLQKYIHMYTRDIPHSWSSM